MRPIKKPNQPTLNSAGFITIHLSQPTKYQIQQGLNILGRHKRKNTIVIQHQSVSDIHCLLQVSVDRCSVLDFGSHNGTYINNFKNKIPVHKQMIIDLDQQILYVSEVKCQFELNSAMKQKINEYKQKIIANELQKQEQNLKKQTVQIQIQVGDGVIQNQNQSDQQIQISSLSQFQNQIADLLKEQSSNQSQSQTSQSQASSNQNGVPIQQLQESSSQEQNQSITTVQPIFRRTRNKRKTDQSGSSLQSHQINNQKFLKIRPRQYLKIQSSCCRLQLPKDLPLKLIRQQQMQFDILIMKQYQRTYKLMISVLKGKPILSIDWITQSQRYGKLLNYKEYSIVIPQRKLPLGYKYNKSRSLLRLSVEAVQKGHSVFKNKSFFFVSRNYSFEIEKMRNIIQLGQGVFVSPESSKPKQSCYAITSKQDNKLGIEGLKKKFKRYNQKFYSEQVIYDSVILQECNMEKYLID